MNKHKKSQSGFTLVELSIVLVIIGLIISSVLVGQDLVRSAELRATITQFEGFNAAVATFRGKYNGLPGDVSGALNFGFTGNGNSDGSLGASTDLAAAAVAPIGENVDFWNHLGSTGAALIAGSYAGASVTSANIAQNLPAAKAGNYWGVFNAGGVNYYTIGVIGAAAGVYATANTLTPNEANGIDIKVDDGKPSKGLVQASSVSATDGNAAADSSGQPTTCISTATAAAIYVTTNNGVNCNLKFRMSL